MSGDDDGPSDFRRSLEGVKPLDRDRLRPEPAPDLRKRPAGPGGERVEFAIERWGERVEGLAPGADPRDLTKLAVGEPEPDGRIDLHDMDAATAERHLRRELARAHDAGARCVLVIHGRGRRSEGLAVLKEAFPDWLAEPGVGPRVLAFASAGPRHGGPGASLVLLRPKPAPRRKR